MINYYFAITPLVHHYQKPPTFMTWPLNFTPRCRRWATMLLTAGSLVMTGLVLQPAHAQWAFELGAVSLYKDRGEDQDERDSNFRPALQGGWQYRQEMGFFVGNWFSTGHFGRAHFELETLAGYSTPLGQQTELALGYSHSIYPRQGDENSGEIFINLAIGQLSLEFTQGMRAGVNKNDRYYNFDYLHPLDDRWALGAGLGYERYGDRSLSDKLDYRAGVFYQLSTSAELSLIVAGANHKHAVDNGIRDNRAILGLSMNF